MTTRQPGWGESFSAQGTWVGLVPLDPAHEAGLIEAVQDGKPYDRWFARVPAPDEMAADIRRRLDLQAAGRMLPFTVLDHQGRIAGMTSYMTLDRANRRVDIGYTWYRASVQRTPLNTEAKLILLAHAFEVLDCIAVGFTTSSFNAESRRALERLGAKLDGILRNHQILADGTIRDTCCYSIIASEWPAVRRHLHWLLRPR